MFLVLLTKNFNFSRQHFNFTRKFTQIFKLRTEMTCDLLLPYNITNECFHKISNDLSLHTLSVGDVFLGGRRKLMNYINTLNYTPHFRSNLIYYKDPKLPLCRYWPMTVMGDGAQITESGIFLIGLAVNPHFIS